MKMNKIERWLIKEWTVGEYGQGRANKSIEKGNIGCAMVGIFTLFCFSIYGMVKLLKWLI